MNLRSPASQTVFIAVMGILVTLLCWQYISTGATSRKATNLIEADRIEESLRLNSARVYFYRRISSNWSSDSQVRARATQDLIDKCQRQLSSLEGEDPKLIADRAILLLSSHKDASQPLHLLFESKDAASRALARDLLFAFSNGASAHDSSSPGFGAALSPAEVEQDLKLRLKPSWYRERTLEALYLKTDEQQKLSTLYVHKMRQSEELFSQLLLIVVAQVICSLIGIIILIVLVVRSVRRRRVELSTVGATALEVSWRQFFCVLLTYVAGRMVYRQCFISWFLQGGLESQPALLSVLLIGVLWLVCEGAALLALYLLVVRSSSTTPTDAILLRFKTEKSGPWRMLFCGPATFLAAKPILALIQLTQGYFAMHDSINPVLLLRRGIVDSGDPSAIAALFLLVALLGPLTEEVVMRGFVYQFLRQRLPVSQSVLISATAFALLHFEDVSFCIFALGAFFALAVERTKSIVPAIIAHMLWNGSWLAMAYLATAR